jgi:hypothetical protein
MARIAVRVYFFSAYANTKGRGLRIIAQLKTQRLCGNRHPGKPARIFTPTDKTTIGEERYADGKTRRGADCI